MVWRDEYSRFVNDGRNVLAATRGSFGDLRSMWNARSGDRRTTRLGSLYTFLRNEPTVLEGDFLCIQLICKYLYRLQARFSGGFVLENEPTGEGF